MCSGSVLCVRCCVCQYVCAVWCVCCVCESSCSERESEERAGQHSRASCGVVWSRAVPCCVPAGLAGCMQTVLLCVCPPILRCWRSVCRCVSTVPTVSLLSPAISRCYSTHWSTNGRRVRVTSLLLPGAAGEPMATGSMVAQLSLHHSLRCLLCN